MSFLSFSKAKNTFKLQWLKLAIFGAEIRKQKLQNKNVTRHCVTVSVCKFFLCVSDCKCSFVFVHLSAFTISDCVYLV